MVRGALAHAAGDEIGQRGARHADVVDAAVLIEALVLRRQDGVDHGLGHILDPHHRPALLAELADQLAVGAVDAQRDLRLVVGEHFQRGQGGIDDGGGKRDQQ